jgi:hypothetical protein
MKTGTANTPAGPGPATGKAPAAGRAPATAHTLVPGPVSGSGQSAATGWALAAARSVWAAAHATAPGVPRWARCAALAVPCLVLPASLWRIAVCTLGLPIAREGVAASLGSSSGVPGVPLGLYVIVLSVFSELIAFTAVGLVARWGEVFPRWVLPLRGRRVPVSFAVIPAALGSVILTLLWTWAAVNQLQGRGINGRPLPGNAPLGFSDWQGILAVACYAPLLLWGPILAALTVSYWRRRRTSGGPTRPGAAVAAHRAAKRLNG